MLAELRNIFNVKALIALLLVVATFFGLVYVIVDQSEKLAEKQLLLDSANKSIEELKKRAAEVSESKIRLEEKEAAARDKFSELRDKLSELSGREKDPFDEIQELIVNDGKIPEEPDNEDNSNLSNDDIRHLLCDANLAERHLCTSSK